MATEPPSPSCRLLDLPGDLLAHIASLLLDEDLTLFWILSRVCADLKGRAERQAGLRVVLGGAPSDACLRKRTTLAEPAVPLARLLRCTPTLTTLDLSGAYWWLKGSMGACAVAEAISGAAFAPFLKVLRLDHCEGLDDAALQRLFQPARIPCEGGCDSMGCALRGLLRLHKWPCLTRSPPALPNLRELSLRSCRALESPAFVFCLPPEQLEKLDLAWCVNLRLDGLELEDVLPNLLFLDVTGIQGAAVDGLVRALPSPIRELRLGMTALSDGGLAPISLSANLKRLVISKRASNLWEEGTFTETGVSDFVRRRPDVEVVFMSA